MESNNIEVIVPENKIDLKKILTNKIKNSMMKIMENTNLIMRNNTLQIHDLRGMIAEVNMLAQESYGLLESLPNIFIENNNYITEDDSLNPNNIIKEIIQFYKSHTSDKKLSVRLSLSDNVNLKVSENKLNFIYRNVILNAFNSTDANDYVEISTKIIDNLFYFVVTDNGKGMSREEVKRIFESDELKNSSLRKCQEIIEGLGGDLIIGSELGVGTKVTVSLPI